MRLILLLATAALAGTPKAPADNAVVVVVRGQDECLTGVVWNEVKSFVSSLFDQINIRLIWQGRDRPPDSTAERVVIFVHFAHTAPARLRENGPACFSPEALACSLPFDVASPTVIVMIDRARLYSRRPKLFQRLLAYSIGHEIAHVIGARTAHSDTGIMKEHWTAADFDRMEYGKLVFTPRDIDFIQEGFDKRHR